MYDLAGHLPAIIPDLCRLFQTRNAVVQVVVFLELYSNGNTIREVAQ